jgi:hypothetical protein
VGAGLSRLVAVGRPAAEEAAFAAGLGGHRGQDPDHEAVPLTLAHPAVEGHLQGRAHHCRVLVAGVGALLAIAWEAGEWYMFLRYGTELDTADEDKLFDEVLGSPGAALAGVVVARRALADQGLLWLG